MSESIHIQNARVNNLKNVTLDIPRNKLVVITGLSGSGKSSLAFDTLYAEGQRRYVESLNALKPNMDKLTELSHELNVIGVHAFAISDDGYTAHVRNFAPLYGVPEESATGTANAALNYYLYRRNIVKHDQECRFMQGEVMKRPSVVATVMTREGTVYVGGHSAIVAAGELLI